MSGIRRGRKGNSTTRKEESYAVLPKIPMGGFVQTPDLSNPIFSWVFTSAGTIDSITADLTGLDAPTATLEITIKQKNVSTIMTKPVKAGINNIDGEFKVSSGDTFSAKLIIAGTSSSSPASSGIYFNFQGLGTDATMISRPTPLSL